MKILIRIYLTHLQQTNENEISNEEENPSETLFYKFRPNYLNQIPPFGPDLKEILLPDHEKKEGFCKRKKAVLFKLQVTEPI